MKKILFIAALAAVAACSPKAKDDYAAPGAPCNCESFWFPHASTPAPKEGIGSPFDTTSTTNCMFHQWSWQKFLWLTKPLANGRVLFEDSLLQVDAVLNPVPHT